MKTARISRTYARPKAEVICVTFQTNSMYLKKRTAVGILDTRENRCDRSYFKKLLDKFSDPAVVPRNRFAILRTQTGVIRARLGKLEFYVQFRAVMDFNSRTSPFEFLSGCHIVDGACLVNLSYRSII
jgi:hypothetical protein